MAALSRIGRFSLSLVFSSLVAFRRFSLSLPNNCVWEDFKDDQLESFVIEITRPHSRSF